MAEDVGLGKTVTVDVVKFVEALGRAGVAEGTEVLKGAVQSSGTDRVVFAQGLNVGDGEINILLYGKGSLTGLLRFRESGEVANVLTNTTVAPLPPRMAKFVIGALFGQGELSSPLGPEDVPLLNGFIASKGCWDADPKTKCRYEKIDAAVKKMNGEKEAKKAAEKRSPDGEGRTAPSVETLITEGNNIWAKAALLIRLAVEQTKAQYEHFKLYGMKIGDGEKINPDELKRIYDDGVRERPSFRPTTLDDAKTYKSQAKNVLEQMLKTYSGLIAVKERPGDIGCELSGAVGWTDHISHIDDAGHIDRYYVPPTKCEAGYTPYYGGGVVSVLCKDIGVSVRTNFEQTRCFDSKPSTTDKPSKSDWPRWPSEPRPGREAGPQDGTRTAPDKSSGPERYREGGKY